MSALLYISHKYLLSMNTFVSDWIVFHSWGSLCVCYLFIHSTNLFLRAYYVPHAIPGFGEY
jgi:hypothetical protein